jgi:hydrolethalus syndrome protein 1
MIFRKGEKNHKNLRWAIREKMLDKHVIVKQQIHQPVNNYSIPTEKKRQDLRWSIRSALANISK